MKTQPRGVTALRQTRPTNAILAELRAAAHRDIDAIFDNLPAMLDQADAPYRERPAGQPTVADYDPDDMRADPDSIKAQGGRPSDPTGDAGTQANPARDWIRTARNVITTAQTLNARIELIIGPAVCPECQQPLGDRKTKRLRGKILHDGKCYMAAYRAEQEAA